MNRLNDSVNLELECRTCGNIQNLNVVIEMGIEFVTFAA